MAFVLDPRINKQPCTRSFSLMRAVASANRRVGAIARHLTAKARDSEAEGFHYTRAEGPLTAEQRRRYEEDGFVIVRGVFDPAELAPLHDKYIDICRNPKDYLFKTVGNLTRDINVVDGTTD